MTKSFVNDKHRYKHGIENLSKGLFIYIHHIYKVFYSISPFWVPAVTWLIHMLFIVTH